MTAKFTRRKFSFAMGSILSVVELTGGPSTASSVEGRERHSEACLSREACERETDDQRSVHNDLIYFRPANDAEAVQHNGIETHTAKVMDNVIKLVEGGGGTVDSILQLTVYLARPDDYDGMNKIFKTYFPHGGPARTTRGGRRARPITARDQLYCRRTRK